MAVTLAIRLGFGKRNRDVRPEDFPAMLLALSFTGSFMIIGAAWSKTSFAVSLLRIAAAGSRIRALIWCIIVSVNLVLGVSALFTWIRCWPLQKMWISSLEGTCWSRWVTLYYNMFTAGACVLLVRLGAPCFLPPPIYSCLHSRGFANGKIMRKSLLGCHGYCARPAALEDALAASDE